MTPLQIRLKAVELAVNLGHSDINRLMTDARRIEAFLLDAGRDQSAAPVLQKAG